MQPMPGTRALKTTTILERHWRCVLEAIATRDHPIVLHWGMSSMTLKMLDAVRVAEGFLVAAEGDKKMFNTVVSGMPYMPAPDCVALHLECPTAFVKHPLPMGPYDVVLIDLPVFDGRQRSGPSARDCMGFIRHHLVPDGILFMRDGARFADIATAYHTVGQEGDLWCGKLITSG